MITVAVAAVLIILSVVLPILMKDQPRKKGEYVISPATPNTFERLFGEAYDENEEYKVAIDYDLLGESDLAHVSARIDVSGDIPCYVVAEGTVDAIALSNDIYWTGVLNGDLVIDEKSYEAYVHFSKLESGDDFMISVSANNESFFFGDLVLDPEKHEEITSHYNFQK